MKRTIQQICLTRAVHRVLRAKKKQDDFTDSRSGGIEMVRLEALLIDEKTFLRDLIQWFFSEN